jgi:hypothetical protein
MAKNNYDPVGTLSIGNVVTTATTLYKSNFKRYFQVSLRATGWLLAIGFLLVGLGIFGGILFGITNLRISIVPVGLIGFVATLFFLAKYATNRAVICRLAYQELIDVPETVAVATQELAPRTWGFLRLSGLVGFYLLLVALISYISLGILMVVAIAVATYGLGLSIDNPNPLLFVCIGLLILGLILLWIVILIRYYAYWFIAELPLAIEQTRSANFSIDRSKQLSKTAVRRMTLIITIAFLITLPINAIGNLPSFFGQIITTTTIYNDSATQSMGGILIFVGFLLNLIGELFVMPFWQVIKAIVYYDLRNRREGSDLII